MRKILKRMTAILTVVVMMLSCTVTSFAGIEYSVEAAYEECAAIYPEFVEKVLAEGATEKQIITLLESIQDYLLDLDVEITEDNFEDYMIEAINASISLRKNVKVRDALVNAFPEAVVDGMDGIISPEFEPLLETIKNILFGEYEPETEPTTEEPDTEPETEKTEPEEEPTTKPTEPEEEPTTKPTEPEEEPTEAPTEAPTKPTTGPSGNSGGPSGDYSDDAEDATEPQTEPVVKKDIFTDINQAVWAKDAIEALVNMKVINGYPDGTFKPNNPITRAEFAKIIVTASGQYVEKDKATYVSKFTDVLPADWEYPYVSAAFKCGFIKGRSETIFDPDSNITRADVCLIAYRYILSVNPEFKAKTDANGAIPTFSDASSVPSWTTEAVNVLYSHSIIPLRDTVNKKLEPTAPATRAECAYIINSAIKAALNLNATQTIK